MLTRFSNPPQQHVVISEAQQPTPAWCPLKDLNPRPQIKSLVLKPTQLNGHIWCREQDLNLRRQGLQPCALPTELSRHKGGLKTTHRQSVTTPKFIVCENEMKSRSATQPGGGDRTRTCTGFHLNGFLDRGSTNYAYSSICYFSRAIQDFSPQLGHLVFL